MFICYISPASLGRRVSAVCMATLLTVSAVPHVHVKAQEFTCASESDCGAEKKLVQNQANQWMSGFTKDLMTNKTQISNVSSEGVDGDPVVIHTTYEVTGVGQVYMQIQYWGLDDVVVSYWYNDSKFAEFSRNPNFDDLNWDWFSADGYDASVQRALAESGVNIFNEREVVTNISTVCAKYAPTLEDHCSNVCLTKRLVHGTAGALLGAGACIAGLVGTRSGAGKDFAKKACEAATGAAAFLLVGRVECPHECNQCIKQWITFCAMQTEKNFPDPECRIYAWGCEDGIPMLRGF